MKPVYLLTLIAVMSSLTSVAQERPPRYGGGEGRGGGSEERRDENRGGGRSDERGDEHRGGGRSDDRNERERDRERERERERGREDRGGGYRPDPRPTPRPEPRPAPRPNPDPVRPDDNYRERPLPGYGDHRRHDRHHDSGRRMPPYFPPSDRYVPPRDSYYPPSEHYDFGSVSFYTVTRRTGGEWLRIELGHGARVNYLELINRGAAIKYHEGYAITRSGQRVSLYDLYRTPTYAYGSVIYADNPYDYNEIIAIDIRAESMGGYADLTVVVHSNEYLPILRPRRF